MVYNKLTAILGVFKWLQNKLPMEKKVGKLQLLKRLITLMKNFENRGMLYTTWQDIIFQSSYQIFPETKLSKSLCKTFI